MHREYILDTAGRQPFSRWRFLHLPLRRTPKAPPTAARALPKYAELKAALAAATSAETSGLNNQMWGTIVDRDGVVCAVAFSGKARDSQWPGSRVIAAQKANTANAFGLDSSSSSVNGSGQAKGLALSTANLFSAVQPGGSLYGSAVQQSRRHQPWPIAELRQIMARPTIPWWEAKSAA